MLSRAATSQGRAKSHADGCPLTTDHFILLTPYDGGLLAPAGLLPPFAVATATF